MKSDLDAAMAAPAFVLHTVPAFLFDGVNRFLWIEAECMSSQQFGNLGSILLDGMRPVNIPAVFRASVW